VARGSYYVRDNESLGHVKSGDLLGYLSKCLGLAKGFALLSMLVHQLCNGQWLNVTTLCNSLLIGNKSANGALNSCCHTIMSNYVTYNTLFDCLKVLLPSLCFDSFLTQTFLCIGLVCKQDESSVGKGCQQLIMLI
jgi:hypothetical protein